MAKLISQTYGEALVELAVEENKTDDFIAEIVNADAVLVTVGYAADLIVQRFVKDRVKVQRADVILIVFIAVGIFPERMLQGAAQDLVFHRVDEEFQFMPQRHRNGHSRASLSGAHFALAGNQRGIVYAFDIQHAGYDLRLIAQTNFVGHLNAGVGDVLALQLLDADAADDLADGAFGFLSHADDQQIAVHALGLNVHQQGHQQADEHHGHSGEQELARAQQNAGVHGKPQAVLVFCALEVGADDVRAYRQTEKQIDDQIYGRAGGANGSQGGFAVFGELTHHDLVSGVVTPDPEPEEPETVTKTDKATKVEITAINA